MNGEATVLTAVTMNKLTTEMVMLARNEYILTSCDAVRLSEQ